MEVSIRGEGGNMPCQTEYQTLRNEIVERISIINSQASNAMSLIITTWAAGFALLGVQATNKTISEDMIILLSVGEEIAFFFAILFLLPMAVKSGENLKQLASLGIYIRVFYEFVPRYRGEKKDLYLWETADKHINICATSKGLSDKVIQMYNMEYVLLGLLSFAFWILVAAYHVSIVFDNKGNGWELSVLIIILVLVSFGALLVLRLVYKQSNNRDNMMKLTEEYTRKYLLLAVHMNYISEDDIKGAWDELNPKNGLDVAEFLKMIRY